MNYTQASKDVKVINTTFDKYLFIKYNTSRPLGLICLFNENKEARVISSFQQKTMELSIEDFHGFQPFNKGNPLKVKDNEQIVSLTSTDNLMITTVPLPPIYDRFHKVSQCTLLMKKQYYITVIDLSNCPKTNTLEIKAFGVVFESEVMNKKPGMIDIYDEYLEMFKGMNKGVLLTYVESTDIHEKEMNLDELTPFFSTREKVFRPPRRPPNNIFYIESKMVKLDKYNIPFLFPIPYKDESQYSVGFYITPDRNKIHIIEVC